MEKHNSHPEIIKRLKRVEGHLKSVIGMIEEGRACIDVAQQLHAVENAITNAKKTFIHEHIDHCLVTPADDGKTAGEMLNELKNISKYL